MFGFLSIRRRFRFLEPGPMVDGELELVEPAARWVDPMMISLQHPACVDEPSSQMSRLSWLDWINRYPRGRERADPLRSRVAMYTFWMRLRRSAAYAPPIEIAGSVSLRIGESDDLRLYLGHIGYGVHPPARGRHLAERATRLLLPLARRHGMTELWITCNPDNHPSRRTCERLGARYVETVNLPEGHVLHQRGERQKMRFLVKL
jgi:predicted acetyltransferase